MKLFTGKILFLFSLLAMTSTVGGRAQQQATSKEEVVVLEFAEVDYPSVPRFRHTSGAVAVQARLDDRGMVTDATALSGEPLLSLAAVENVKKWRFRPSASKSAVIVYNFVYLEGRCKSNGSLFVLAPSNLVTVVALLR